MGTTPGDPRGRLGREGEARAAELLASAGYAVLARNVRAGGVELDLVAARGGVAVFVEVKTRRGRRHGAPAEAVDARKRARLVRGAAAWLAAQPRRYARARFDLVTCEVDGEAWHLEHWPAAFDAGDV
jgi:putative endonuclease